MPFFCSLLLNESMEFAFVEAAQQETPIVLPLIGLVWVAPFSAPRFMPLICSRPQAGSIGAKLAV